jgi:hypothetical protein
MQIHRQRKLRWVKPEQPVFDDGLTPLGDLANAQPPNPLRDLIAEVGIPTFDAATTREEVIMILLTAAEIEHALMVQYLYALYSLKLEGENFTLQESLHTIAIQEMGHLMTVQNLLLMLGESPYLSRQDLSPQINLDPITFRLEPFTKTSLAKYVSAESPLMTEDNPDFNELKTIMQEAKIANLSDVHRVGLIYAKLYWLFQKTDAQEGPWVNLPRELLPQGDHLKDEDFRLGNDLLGRQADSNEWNASVSDFFVDSTETRGKALEAIWRIAAQGEGFENMEGSHFSQFRRVYRNFTALPQPPHLEIPVNPTVGDAPLDDPNLEQNRISNIRSRQWAHLFNQRYLLLLLCLRHTFSYNKANQAEREIRAKIKSWALQEMRTGLKLIAQILITQPRFENETSTGTATFAAAPFTLKVETFPVELLELWLLQKNLSEESLQLISQMQQFPDLTLTEKNCLSGLQTATSKRIEFIADQIAVNHG